MLISNSPYYRLRTGYLSTAAHILIPLVRDKGEKIHIIVLVHDILIDPDVCAGALSCLASLLSACSPLPEVASLLKCSSVDIPLDSAFLTWLFGGSDQIIKTPAKVDSTSSTPWILDACFGCFRLKGKII